MSLEAQQRQAVVAEAMTWLGTPYAHRQACKGCGVDCAQLPLAVYAAAGVIAPIEVGGYSAQWHLHRTEELYLGWVLRFAAEIAFEDAHAGDFMLFRYGRTFSHGAILVDPPRVIHAETRARRVTLDDVTVHQQLRARERRTFSPWAVPAEVRASRRDLAVAPQHEELFAINNLPHPEEPAPAGVSKDAAAVPPSSFPARERS